MKLTLKEGVFWILIIFIFGLGIYLVYYINSESYQCMNDPYVYSIKLLEKSNDAEVSCLCTAQRGARSSTVLLTRNGFSKLPDAFGGDNSSFEINTTGWFDD